MFNQILLPVKYFLIACIGLLACNPVIAQAGNGTYEDGFLLKLYLPDGSKPLFENKTGGYGYAYFGADVVHEMEGDLAWARTASGDSLCCGPATNDLAGKIALLRRSDCSFIQKCINAQKSGAKAVIVLNHYTSPFEDEQTILNMQTGLNSDSVTVPCIFVCRKVGKMMTDAIDSGLPMKARFVFRNLDKATVAYHYSTPLRQVDTLKHVTVHFFNPGPDTVFTATVDARIAEPGGNTVHLSVPVAGLLPGRDTLLIFPPYLPAATKGVFEVVFSNTFFQESEDTVRRKFEISEHTWASDNGVIVPGGVQVDGPGNQIGFIQYGALYHTGDTSSKAAYVTFGLANAAVVYSPLGNDANSIAIIIYDADADGDGEMNLVNNWDDLSGYEIGFGVYVINGNEKPDSLITWPVAKIDNINALVELKPSHWYYVSLLYDGANAGTFLMPAFSKTTKENYFNFPSTPVQLASSFYKEGFCDCTVIQRLLQDNPMPNAAQNLLDPSLFSIAPNPATEHLRLELNLKSLSRFVNVSLFDLWGQHVARQSKADFHQGTIDFEVGGLPSGTYLLWIRTEEGSAIRKVAICH